MRRDWMAERRYYMRINHEQAAELCGISRSYYTMIENGTKTPTPAIAKRIANALKAKHKWKSFYEGD